MQILAKEAAARDIVVVDPKKARYLVRGYLSASGATDGAAVEYVWDVFTRDRQRSQRVNDVIDTKGENPWRDEALKSIAANSAEDLAAYLSNTPEAAASAEPTTPDAKAMSYAVNSAPTPIEAGQRIHLPHAADILFGADAAAMTRWPFVGPFDNGAYPGPG